MNWPTKFFVIGFMILCGGITYIARDEQFRQEFRHGLPIVLGALIVAFLLTRGVEILRFRQRRDTAPRT